MIINSLYLNNVGVFRGHHEIDLTPRVKYGRKRPIILFGGLNGAGKTTTLTAVRLALYGRQSFGRNISLHAYHQQLSDLIHKPPSNELAPYSAEVGLRFSYGKNGKVSEISIKRAWERKGSKVVEHLEIFQDKDNLSELNEEQKQSFLNELAPIGVSDLFFFDGEKIAELAEDDTSEALIDAINRLLGLDIIERLRADLGIYLRDNTQTKLPKEIKAEIKQLEELYAENYSTYQRKLSEIEELKTIEVATQKDIAAVNLRINDLGGAWARSREAAELKSEHLIKEKRKLIAEMQDLFSDSLPLALATRSLKRLQKNLASEKETKERIATREKLEKHIQALRSQLAKELGSSCKPTIDSAIDGAFFNLRDKSKDSKIVHDISDSSFNKLNSTIESYVPKQVSRLKKLGQELEKIEDELSSLSIAIARAPDQARLDDVLSELAILQQRLGEISIKLDSARDDAKHYLRLAMENLRRLRDLGDKYTVSLSHGQGVELASKTREMLEEFGELTKKRKISILEDEFIKSFCKLVRKEDMNIQAKINPENFSVDLFDKHGNTINRKKLSAGEKQIYAIAMLEALGRTSGKNLPIIIDTPLGRLDSKHRANLVNNYFPTASHQVLILSTDTEIDEDFYSALSPETSHAFSVDYDPDQGCSYYNEGYFWR
ncbi:MAG: DNA sulfur modification protein DndD [Gammaproteobacteria bacterium]|nr:DNA sulfur modification protein DndD [Gammaproteobacteria bacterium]